jgi:GNAT superfamily N-acetyltransferase
MFWKGKTNALSQIQAWIQQKECTIDTISIPSLDIQNTIANDCTIQPADLECVDQITSLLNHWFEPRTSRTKMQITAEWIKSTYVNHHAIWIVARDRRGTVRGCVSSFMSVPPYPIPLTTCGSSSRVWGVVDWFCVHPLWRSKGIGSKLLEVLEYITHQVGRKAHVFIKEGLPLPLPHIPIYATVWKYRRAGTDQRVEMSKQSGLYVHPFFAVADRSELPLIRVEGLRKAPPIHSIKEWEDALDNDLPPCIVFVTGADYVDSTREWMIDSPVYLYAFRWTAGKSLGSVPNSEIL